MNRISGFLGLAVSVVMTSCAGVGFNSAWNKAVEEYDAGQTSPVTGPWTGTWLSGHNGHTGDLRCLVSPVKSSDEFYRFRYHATWGRFLRGGFKVNYPVVPEKGGYTVNGTKKIGPFGTFDHEGRIEGDTFDAKFKSSMGDHGDFKMTRPGSVNR